MSSSKASGGGESPHLLFTAPSFGSKRHTSSVSDEIDSARSRRRRSFRSEIHDARHVRVQALLPNEPKSSASSVYMGSYGRHSPRRSRTSLKTPGSSAPGSPRPSMSQTHLETLLQDLDLDLETYGVEELRDGFFDSSFFKPPKTDHDELMREAECSLPLKLRKKDPLSPSNFLPKQWHEIKGVIQAVTTTRSGIKLTKSFLAFFIAYILCLIPVIKEWLGRYSYIMVLSAIINHPGRTIGAQIDGALSTIVGSATGLGWGAFALWVSDSTDSARRGYGGILAMFLILFMGTIAALRSYLIRMYQLVLCAGIAVTYTLLADTSEAIDWKKLFNFAIPWLFGQALCLLICCTVFPDAGARPLAVTLHNAFAVMQRGLLLPQPHRLNCHRDLAWTFVNLSQAYRDLVLDISITRFRPSDVMALRNLMQAVIRSLLSLRMESQVFDNSELVKVFNNPETDHLAAFTVNDNADLSSLPKLPTQNEDSASRPTKTHVDAIIDIEVSKPRPSFIRTETGKRAVDLVTSRLGDPTSKLLSCMKSSLERCDAVLMNMSGYRKYLGPSEEVSSDIIGSLTKLRKLIMKYDEEEESLMENPALPPTYSDHPEVVELFLFVHPIRQAATTVEALLVKIMEMQQRKPGWRIYLPSYPFRKALQRTNAQVRHDRGGVTAGFFFHSQTQLAKTMKGMTNVYQPHPHATDKPNEDDLKVKVTRTDTIGKYEEEEDVAMDRTASKKKRLRYKVWLILHRLQGFETRFALKVAVVTSLLAIPAWLHQSREWWNENESWWAVVMVWVMMHPRVGGNFQDLITRALCGILGAVWGGLAYYTLDGNPYVMVVFAVTYMLPMIYRFTQSSHPRSGIVGCISFVVVSLGAKAAHGLPSVAQISWTRGLAFVVGVVAAVVVNWVLWPFVARHELRKALANMLIYSSIIYRGVVAKYVYYEKGDEPGKEDIERSEMLEGRLREGFVRIRQLMALTRHEIRLRGPFNPLPYSALIDACERFFEYLVAVRQSSLFFHPHFISDNEQAAESLLTYRRDAVAAILMNLYVLAGALRGARPVPRYLPSAAAARKRLLDHMAMLEAWHASHPNIHKLDSERENRKWSQIYSYSYSESLTGCVEQLDQLQKYTKEIVGEQGFDPVDLGLYRNINDDEVERTRTIHGGGPGSEGGRRRRT